MFGSSIIKRAFVASFLRPGGSDLNLDRLNITLWWQGYGGLEIVNAIQKLQVLKQVGPLPSAIFIHCGGNDLRQNICSENKVSNHKNPSILRLGVPKCTHYMVPHFAKT